MSNVLFSNSIRYFLVVALVAEGFAQTVTRSGDEPGLKTRPVSGPVGESVGYVLGPEDEIAIRAIDCEDISEKPMRIDSSGFIRLPLAGRVKAEGVTTEQLEIEIARRLQPYVKNPQVTVTVSDPRSNPISVLGAVKNPGVHQIQGPKTLAEALALAGGLVDDSGYKIKITRQIKYGTIPLAGAVMDSTGQYSIAEVNVRELMDLKDPRINVLVRPHDMITIPRAETIYVIGEVNKPGGFTLRERESLTVLQALSLAQGTTKIAQIRMARLLRPDLKTGERVQIPVNLRDIMLGKAEDLRMRSDDVLFIPDSAAKNAALRGMEAAIQIGTGLVIWRR